MRMRRTLLGGTALVLASTLALTGCGDDGDDSASGDKGSVVVVTAGFTEIDLMAQMYAELLEEEGYDVEIKTVANRENYAPTLISGESDIVPDYLGTMTNYLYSLEQDDPDATVATSDVEATLAELRRLAGDKGLTVLEPAEATSQNAYAVSRTLAEDNDITTLSQLGESGLEIRIAAPEECKSRPLCGVLLEKEYGVDITKYTPFEFNSPTAKKQVQDGKADMAVVSTLAADLGDYDLVILEDDKGLQPAENLVPVIGKDSPLAGDEDVAEALRELSEVLVSTDLGALIIRVDQDREELADVARDYLESKNLL